MASKLVSPCLAQTTSSPPFRSILIFILTAAKNDTPNSIDDYIASFPEDVQELLKQVRETILAEAPEATETIKYRMPTYVLHGNLVHFAGYKKHIGFYPGSAGIVAFKDEFAGLKWAKGSVQFPLHRPIPFDLIARIVRFRVAQNAQTAATKSK